MVESWLVKFIGGLCKFYGPDKWAWSIEHREKDYRCNRHISREFMIVWKNRRPVFCVTVRNVAVVSDIRLDIDATAMYLKLKDRVYGSLSEKAFALYVSKWLPDEHSDAYTEYLSMHPCELGDRDACLLKRVKQITYEDYCFAVEGSMSVGEIHAAYRDAWKRVNNEY